MGSFEGLRDVGREKGWAPYVRTESTTGLQPGQVPRQALRLSVALSLFEEFSLLLSVVLDVLCSPELDLLDSTLPDSVCFLSSF